MPQAQKRPFKYRRRTGTKSRTLNAKNNKTVKDFKNIDNYLESVYRNNKEYLDKYIDKMGDSRTKKNIFKNEVKRMMKYTNPVTGKKYTVRQAIDIVQRSTMITTDEERWGEQALERLRESDKTLFKKFRQLVGWKSKISSMNFVEMTSDDTHNYLVYQAPATGKKIIIVEEISPKTGVVRSFKLEEDYDEWRYQYVKNNKKNDPALNAEFSLLEALRVGREKMGGK